MKNTFGTSVSVTLFGESHGTGIGAVLDGLAPGIEVRETFIRQQLALRCPTGDSSTARREGDSFQIFSGVFQGKTTGTPLTILIQNEDIKSGDYDAMRTVARPGHADYTADCKFHGFQDYRGGGHFSGRVTAALTAVGAVALDALAEKGIRIGTHIRECAGICDRAFAQAPENDIQLLRDRAFAVLDEAAGERMKRAISAAKADGDSVGGMLETAITGVPAGVGEPWFDTVEGVLSHALFGIPAVKGVQFGDGFGLASMRGSEANDGFYMDGNQIRIETNHNGGINGGITNGMPILFSCAVKPTPSIAITQKTVDFSTKTNTELSIQGRHDPAIVHRARVVIDSVSALVLCDLLAQRYGTDYLAPGGTA